MINKILISVEKVKENFRKYPDIFLTENDLRSHLFAELLDGFSDIKTTIDQSKSIDLHTEVRWYGNDNKLKFRSDIVIIDASDLKTKNSTIFKLPSKGFAFNRFSAIIETKLRRINGSSDVQFTNDIKKDIKKLQSISEKVSSDFNGFIVVFDKKNNIKNKVDNLVRSENIDVIYAYPQISNNKKN